MKSESSKVIEETKYKGVIFDLDGVICHTDVYHYIAWKQVADRLDLNFDETINNLLRGVSRMESLDIILERNNRELSKVEKTKCAEEKNEIYQKLLADMSPSDLMLEIRETLDILRGKGLKLAIGSSSKNAMFILKQIGLGDYFDAISDGNNISRSKPDPEVFLKAACYLKLAPGECLVVEDARAGLMAAIAGNMDCAAIGEAVSTGVANYELAVFSDLLKFV